MSILNEQFAIMLCRCHPGSTSRDHFLGLSDAEWQPSLIHIAAYISAWECSSGWSLNSTSRCAVSVKLIQLKPRKHSALKIRTTDRRWFSPSSSKPASNVFPFLAQSVHAPITLFCNVSSANPNCDVRAVYTETTVCLTVWLPRSVRSREKWQTRHSRSLLCVCTVSHNSCGDGNFAF